MPDQQKTPRSFYGHRGEIMARTLISLRWLAVLGQSAAIILVSWYFGFSLPLVPLGALVLALVALNVFLSVRLSASERLAERQATIQLSFDLFQLAGMLFFTGGLSNPFAVMMLVPITVAATVLGWRATRVLMFLLITLCIVLWQFSLPLPWIGDGLVLPELYLAGIWSALLLTAGFVVWYISRVAEEARLRTAALRAMETALAEEHQLAALGALSAAAAHELGTPLGTIVLAGAALRDDMKAGDANLDDVETILSQAARCREILQRLGGRAEDQTQPEVQLTPERLLRAAADEFRGLGKDIIIKAERSESVPPIPKRSEIMYGLTNFIENAVDFSRENVELDAWLEDEVLCIEISDDGPGFDPSILPRIGEPYLSLRPKSGTLQLGGGSGLGAFIGRTLWERMGATVSFRNKEEGGACVLVRWPLSELRRVAQSSMNEMT